MMFIHFRLLIDPAPFVPFLTTRQQDYQSVVSETSTEDVQKVQKLISELKKSFNRLKDAVRECLEKHHIIVKKVVNVLTSLSPDEDDRHIMFLESHVRELCAAVDLYELFVTMNFHWNYLDPSLLEHLVQDLELEEVTGHIETYKSDLQQFRMKTPLILFTLAQRRKRTRPSSDFQEMVAEFDWPENITLEVVEQFRQEYASHYNLQQCAMMIAHIRPGSFIVTWFIYKSITDKLKENVPKEILKKYYVKAMDIAGTVIYQSANTAGAITAGANTAGAITAGANPAGALAFALGVGCTIVGAGLTATGALAPVGVPLIGAGVVTAAAGAAAIREEKRRKRMLKRLFEGKVKENTKES